MRHVCNIYFIGKDAEALSFVPCIDTEPVTVVGAGSDARQSLSACVAAVSTAALLAAHRTMFMFVYPRLPGFPFPPVPLSVHSHTGHDLSLLTLVPHPSTQYPHANSTACADAQ